MVVHADQFNLFHLELCTLAQRQRASTDRFRCGLPQRADIWRYYRLRVLRISTDLNLGCGIWSIPEGADYLEQNVPMDKGTAVEDAWMYLATPGLGLSYGIGKAQIMRYLAMARQHHDAEHGPDGAPFDLRAFHDSLWLNGNVPIELQAYETLGGPPPPAIRRLFGEAAKL